MSLPCNAIELRRRFLASEVTAEEICRFFLRRIEQTEPAWGAWITVDGQGALEAAVRLDHRKRRGEPLGRLAGVPVAVKDQIATCGVRTTCGSKMLQHFVPTYDAHVVERLKCEDAILLGKTNQDEFAMGSSNEHSAFRRCANPWNPSFVPGGSSGGSAAAVAAGHVPLALGTDTGGSVRLPAAFCGLVGLRPTYGRVSRFGLIPFASSMDQAGPLARSVAEAAMLFSAIAGFDSRDATCSMTALPDLRGSRAAGVGGLRVGIVKEFMDGSGSVGVADDVLMGMRATRQALVELGASVSEVSLPLLSAAVPAYCVLAAAEASSNLARYDGLRIRYADGVDAGPQGALKPEGIGELGAALILGLEEHYCQVRSAGFGAEVKRRILLGAFVLQAGYYQQYYAQAARVRGGFQHAFDRLFEECDVILLPSGPVVGFRFGECTADPLQMYRMDQMTVPASLAGLPAICLPVGVAPNGLPQSVQFMAPRFAEERLFAVGFALEAALGFLGQQAPEPGPWAGTNGAGEEQGGGSHGTV